jgi:SEC-C motif
MPSTRNAPCPCGSGRKRKRCCDARLDEQAALRRRDERVGDDMEAWALAHHGDELRAAARTLLEELPGAPQATWIAVQWALLDHELRSGGTAAARYAGLPRLPAGDRESAERIAASRVGLFWVLGCRPGAAIDLEEVLAGGTVTAASTNVSRSASAGDLLLARVMTGPTASLWGPARAYSDRDAIALLDAIERAMDHDDDDPMARIWPSLMTLDARTPPVMAHAAWKIQDAEAAFARLAEAFEYDGEDEDGADVFVWRLGDRDEDYVGFVELYDDGLFLCALGGEALLDEGIAMIEAALGEQARLVERAARQLHERRTRRAHRRMAA